MLLFTLNDPHHFLKSNKQVNQKIKKLCQSLCCFLHIKKQFVFDIRIVNQNEIKTINKKYRHVNHVTDIITFAFNDNKDVSTFLLGEMLICYPFCIQEAKKSHKTIEHMFYFLVVHGILHMFGFSHKTQQNKTKMWKITKMILKNCHIK